MASLLGRSHLQRVCVSFVLEKEHVVVMGRVKNGVGTVYLNDSVKTRVWRPLFSFLIFAFWYLLFRTGCIFAFGAGSGIYEGIDEDWYS